MPKGGRRIGAGRKPKLKTARIFGAKVLKHPSASTAAPVPQVDEAFDAPETLTAEERKVWDRQSPHAFAHGTLTRATSLAFERYCKLVVMEQNESKSSAVGGANHRGILKQLNALEVQFILVPTGKAMLVTGLKQQSTPEPEDSDAEFFG